MVITICEYYISTTNDLITSASDDVTFIYTANK